MTPKRPDTPDPDQFRMRLDQIIDTTRPLIRKSEWIEWKWLFFVCSSGSNQHPVQLEAKILCRSAT